jgi:hypothetical protein
VEDIRIIYDLLQEVRSEQRKQSEELCNQTLQLLSIQKDVSANTNDLSEHIRRTDLLEEQTNILRNSTDCKIQTLNDRIVALEWPSKVKEFIFNKYVKWAGAISVAVGIIYSVLRIFKIC